MHDALFKEIDRRWAWPEPAKIQLHVIGSGALMMQFDYARRTSDGDVFETLALDKSARTNLKALAGKGTALSQECGLYLDVVPNGLPFLPHVPRWHPLAAVSATLTHFELHALDVVDVVVSKLKRFARHDQDDIRAMIERELVPHDQLVERFRAAVDCFAHDARADELPAIIKNLHLVERDLLFAPPTEIELPHWI